MQWMRLGTFRRCSLIAFAIALMGLTLLPGFGRAIGTVIVNEHEIPVSEVQTLSEHQHAIKSRSVRRILVRSIPRVRVRLTESVCLVPQARRQMALTTHPLSGHRLPNGLMAPLLN